MKYRSGYIKRIRIQTISIALVTQFALIIPAQLALTVKLAFKLMPATVLAPEIPV